MGKGGEGEGVQLGAQPSEGGGGGPVGVARSREGVLASSGTDMMEAGGSQVGCSCGSRGEGGTDMWTGPEGGAEPQRERRRERGGQVGPVFKFNPNLMIQTVRTCFNPTLAFPNFKNLK
jgi:hypothetical protein